ncbi:type II/IV secretion system protein [bacterium]|nr:type II/IV secretion system protein [bacterium]
MFRRGASTTAETANAPAGPFHERAAQLTGDIPALVDALLDDAADRRAGDVHLTPTPEGIEVRYRLDGVLADVALLPPSVSASVIARLKVLAGLLTYRTDVPQEGRIEPLNRPQKGEIRLSTFPTLHGERAALRFVTGTEVLHDLDRLALPDAVVGSLRRAISATSGLVIITGPAGAGKTTTLYSCLRAIVADPHTKRAVITLEDPVERALEGVSQTSLDRRDGGSLAALVKAVLRQDPDVIAIGEIRDRATARAAMQAALTGHLVLTTTHAGDTVEVLTRLSDMRIPPYILRSGLRAVLAQRLVRRLCTACRVEMRSDDTGINAIDTELRNGFEANPVGCEACRGTGYSGRAVIAEWLETGDDALSRSLTSRIDARKLRRLRAESGAQVLADDALRLIAEGVTSPLEVARVLGVSSN